MAMIHEALAKIKAEVGAVTKDGFNQAQRFKFRSIDGIYNAVHPIFAKHGVFTVPRVVGQTFERYETGKGTSMKSAQLLVEYDLMAADGSFVKFGPMAGEGSDSGDKATSKALAMAHKYMLIEALQLQTEDGDPDADTAPPRQDQRPQRRDPGPPPEDPPAGAAAPDMAATRKKLVESMIEWVSGDKIKSKAIVGFILPGQSSISQLQDPQVRRFARGWWLYKLMGGKEDEVREFLKLPGLPWFDKMSDDELKRLHGYCQEEAKRQEQPTTPQRGTVSPSTKDDDGNDPF